MSWYLKRLWKEQRAALSLLILITLITGLLTPVIVQYERELIDASKIVSFSRFISASASACADPAGLLWDYLSAALRLGAALRKAPGRRGRTPFPQQP